jgi:hypothetical protein
MNEIDRKQIELLERLVEQIGTIKSQLDDITELLSVIVAQNRAVRELRNARR